MPSGACCIDWQTSPAPSQLDRLAALRVYTDEKHLCRMAWVLTHWSHMPTITEVDEALGHAQAIPNDERGAAWHAFVDRLLEQRAALNPHAKETP